MDDQLRNIRPVTTSVSVNVEGDIELTVGVSPTDIQKGQVIVVKLAHYTAANLGKLLVYIAQHSPAAELAAIQNDVDEIHLPPMG